MLTKPATLELLSARTVAAALVVLLGMVIVREAWTGDDAFITYRTLENFVAGHGLRWNVAERVQSYTHPLWLFTLVPGYLMTGDPYSSGLATGMFSSALAVWLVLLLARGRPWHAVIVLTAMVFSKAFTEYSTSGLENPLSHALLAAIVLAAIRPVEDRRHALLLGLLVGGLALTRLDLLLLGGPIAASVLRWQRRTIAWFAIGLLPLAGWEAFSIVYYGAPFPNTAYAKLGAGIPSHELMLQGIVYVVDLANRDPLTLFVILLGVFAALLERRQRIVAVAVVVYLLYVVRIGGDFMSGRFFTAPFVVSLCLIAGWRTQMFWTGRLAVLGGMLALGLSVPTPTIYSGPSYTTRGIENIDVTGIADERGFYFQNFGFLTASGPRWRDNRDPMERYVQSVDPRYPRVTVSAAAGRVGFMAGPDRYVVDPLALCDPLLARLPSTARPWRVGHYERPIPAGYIDSLGLNRNLIEDPEVRSLYEVIREVTRASVWSGRRWRAILALNTGRTSGWSPQGLP